MINSLPPGMVLILGALLIAACEDEATTAVPVEAASKPCPTSGEDAYRQFCARCHDSGKDGAPVVGNRVDWAERPKLWQAVAMEHAKSGYFEMPARGGNACISDETTTAAAEYMLESTYPDIPPD